MGSDANVANSNANLKQGASVQNQANALKVGTANLGNAVQAQQLDSAAQLQMAIEQQRQGLLSQEAKDQRTLGNANLGLTQAQYQAQKANAANQAYLDQINLELEQQQLAARAKMGVYGLQQQQTANDRALLAGITGGIAAPLGALAINLGQSSSTPTATPTAAPTPTPVFGMQLGLSPNLTTPTQLASSVGA
jgi:small-conductance mechanosensitive channel